MTDEERQRQMDFIVNTLARLTASTEAQAQANREEQASTAERQARSEARLDRLERIAKLIVRAGLRARRQMREQDARITTLVDSQIHTEELTRQNSEAISKLEKVVAHNSASISELAEIVRQLATRGNGSGAKESNGSSET